MKKKNSLVICVILSLFIRIQVACAMKQYQASWEWRSSNTYTLQKTTVPEQESYKEYPFKKFHERNCTYNDQNEIAFDVWVDYYDYLIFSRIFRGFWDGTVVLNTETLQTTNTKEMIKNDQEYKKSFKVLRDYYQTWNYYVGPGTFELSYYIRSEKTDYTPVIDSSMTGTLQQLYTNEEADIAIGAVTFPWGYFFETPYNWYLFKIKMCKEKKLFFLTPIQLLATLNNYKISKIIAVPQSSKVMALTNQGELIIAQPEKKIMNNFRNFNEYYDGKFIYKN